MELVLLLLDSRLREFYSLLELISVEDRASDPISLVVELERQLMEGSYDLVLQTQLSPKALPYAWLLELLESTVKEELASCIEVSYPKISVAKAKALLKEVPEEREGWVVEGDTIVFEEEEEEVERIPARELIETSLHYASESEKIV